MRVVFFGSAEFGLPTLQRLIEAGHQVACVVTTPSRPKGRGLRPQPSPVFAFAEEAGLQPILTPDDVRDPGFAAQLAEFQADVFVIVAYRILPESVFAIPTFGTLNVHASLLPQYRGPAPIQRAIEHGEQRTGVTVFRIDRGVDTGGVLLQRSLAIGPEETTPELYQRLSRLGADALVAALEQMSSGCIAPQPQKQEGVSRAPKLRKDEGLLDWREPATVLFNRIRAFKPYPGTWTVFRGKRLGIEWAEATQRGDRGEPGTVCRVDARGFDVVCGKGSLLVLRVRPEGKPTMDAGAYVRGARLSEGMVLG